MVCNWYDYSCMERDMIEELKGDGGMKHDLGK
jgi:hypothetical protein